MRKRMNSNEVEILEANNLVQEKAWLGKNYPLRGEVATEEYKSRAKAFNEKCNALGLKFSQVIEG